MPRYTRLLLFLRRCFNLGKPFSWNIPLSLAWIYVICECVHCVSSSECATNSTEEQIYSLKMLLPMAETNIALVFVSASHILITYYASKIYVRPVHTTIIPVCRCTCIFTVSRLLVAQWKLSWCQAHLTGTCHLKRSACSRTTNDQLSYVTLKTRALLHLEVYQFFSFCRRQPSKNEPLAQLTSKEHCIFFN